MKVLKAISGFIFLVFSFSCEEVSISLINCNDCSTDEPSRAQLEIKLERLSEYAVSNPTITVTIYEGKLEDNVIFGRINTSNYEVSIDVPINKEYCVTARYYIDGNIYLAVCSVMPQVRYSEDDCSEPCYYIKGNKANLRLKYTK